MNKPTQISLFTAIISYVFIALWAYAALSKLMDWEMNQRAMLMQPFPDWMGNALAWFIPLLELVLVIFLLQTRTRIKALQASILLLGIFSLYILLLLTRIFGKIPCACSGIFSQMGHAEHLYFNLVFIILGWTAMIWTHKGQKQERARSVFSQKGGVLEQ